MTDFTKCPYCWGKAELVNGDKIYPHRPDLYGLNFWYCDNAHSAAYVGCHKGTQKPLGRLANGELRKMKSAAHAAFDPLWKNGYFSSRTKAYNWLANALNIDTSKCHIGMFDIDMCRRVIDVCENKKNATP